jgi:hypothetical protein
MNRLILSFFISLIFTSTSLWARTLPENFNAAANQNSFVGNAVLAPKAAALVDGDQPVQMDYHSHLPRFLWAAAKPESARAKTRSVNKNPSPAEIEQAARQHLSRYASIYRLSKKNLSSAKLKKISQLGESGHIVRFGQQVGGVEVFARNLSLLLDKSLELSAISGNLMPYERAEKSTFTLDAAEAIAAAFNDLHQEDLPVGQLILDHQQGAYQWYDLATPLPAQNEFTLSKAVRIKKVLFPMEKTLVPAYFLELNTKSTTAKKSKVNYAYVISAVDGALLSRSNKSRHDKDFSYRVWADPTSLMPFDSPFGNFALSPMLKPLTNPAAATATNLITLTCGPISTCDPWLPDNATKTVGNNVLAYADLNAPDGFGFGDLYAATSSSDTFNYSYNFTLPDNLKNSKQLQAAIVQAFYTTNFMHDWLYDHGFDEAAGNGQKNNFGRGGLGNDPMLVEVNDFSETDNATMYTPEDGSSAILQLFPFTHELSKLEISFGGKKRFYPVTTAAFGPENFQINAKNVVLINDGAVTPTDGCQTPIVNAQALKGKIALIDRGDCLFAEKAKHAQDAGAIAVLIANNVADTMIPMAGSGDYWFDIAVTIPLLGLNKNAGTEIKQALTKQTVTANLTRKPQLPLNSALDNTIIIHEWGHFLSDRLTELDNNQGRSLGEGWSDFLALLAIVKQNDRTRAGNNRFQAPYAIGQYVSPAQPNNYLYGLRRYPYSTNRNKNPLTFKHISDGVALPVGIPAAPYTDMAGTSNSQIHSSGEVWASMLWDAYAALLNDPKRLTFSQAQDRMLDYLVASLKMTPIDPTFLEARDALLAVAKLRDTADYNAFRKAFSKRGAGKNAKAPVWYSTSHLGVVEDFTLP